jgi:hypothetical protein
MFHLRQVEDSDYVGERAEEQEVLLHDLNDVLAAVVAARSHQQEVRAVRIRILL